jgi:sugar lactone lactonase YvrE
MVSADGDSLPVSGHPEAVRMGDLDVEVALHMRMEHAEGPIWDALSNQLWWVDITGERVHCLDPISGSASSWPTQGRAGGVVIDTESQPVPGTSQGLAVLDRTTGSIRLSGHRSR